MNIEDLRTYCLSKNKVTEDFPFDESVLTFKVINKMFALTNVDSEVLTVNLKCDPEYALELRERHPEVKPGYHMNKKHWNTVECEGALGESFIQELIDHSYDLVVSKLPLKLRKEVRIEES